MRCTLVIATLFCIVIVSNCLSLDLVAYNKNKDTVSLYDSTKLHFIVMVHTVGCSGCYVALNRIVKYLSEEYDDIRYSVLIRCNTSKLSMKESIIYFKPHINIRDFLFDIHSDQKGTSDSEGIFPFYKVNYAPTVLLTYKNKHLFLSYEKLFGEDQDSFAVIADAIRKIRNNP